MAILEVINLLLFVVWLVREKRRYGKIPAVETTGPNGPGFVSYGSGA
jgi:hypothetical protein